MILSSVIILGTIGILAAVLLYLAAKKFHVEEDPRIAEVEEFLPGANCGGCGLSGCHAFAVECCKAKSLDSLNCVGVTTDTMSQIAHIVGLAPAKAVKRIAIIKCSADCETRSHKNFYDGARSCAVENALYHGEIDCVYGCLGCGDCVEACPFGAMYLPEGETLPQIDPEKCTACGRCVAACPRHLVELAVVSDSHPLIKVACSNRNKGAVAMKDCDVSCIGCGICKKNCEADAITVADFLAHIDSEKCTGCETCVSKCPRHSIVVNAVNVERVS